MKKLKWLLTFALIVGCASAGLPTKALITGQKYAPYEGLVQIFLEPPEMEYEQVGLVSVRGKTKTQMVDLVEALQKEAANIGANGLIVQMSQTATTGAMLGSSGGLAGFTRTHLIGVAIRTE